MKELWQELAAVQAQLEQVHAKLTDLVASHTHENCCMFCEDLQTAAGMVGDATQFLSEAVAAEREHNPDDDEDDQDKWPDGPDEWPDGPDGAPSPRANAGAGA